MLKIGFYTLEVGSIFWHHYETKPPQYDHALSDITIRYDIDPLLRTLTSFLAHKGQIRGHLMLDIHI